MLMSSSQLNRMGNTVQSILRWVIALTDLKTQNRPNDTILKKTQIYS